MEYGLERRVVAAAMRAAGAVRSQVFENRELSRSAKILMYNGMIVPTLTYEAESWVVKENEKQRLQEAEMRGLGKTLRVHRIDHVRNQEIIIIR